MNELIHDASNKLAYIIHLKQTTPSTQQHKLALLTYYIGQIQESITELTNKISEIHDTVSGSNVSYEDVYEKTVQSSKNNTKFMQTFGPYMMLWQSLNNNGN